MAQYLFAHILLVLSAGGQQADGLTLEIECARNRSGVRMVLRNQSSDSKTVPDQLLPWSLSGDVIEWDWSKSNLQTDPRPALITKLGETFLEANDTVEVVVKFDELLYVSDDQFAKLGGTVEWRIKPRAAQILGISGAGHLHFDKGVCVREANSRRAKGDTQTINRLPNWRKAQ